MRTLALAALAPALAGCLQGEQLTELYPHGSGKIVLRLACRKTAADAAEQRGLNLIGLFSNPDDLRRNSEGIVAWSRGIRQEEGGWVRFTVTGYFEDINRVRLYGDGEDGPDLQFAARHEKGEARNALVLPNLLLRPLQEKLSKLSARTRGTVDLKEAAGEAMEPFRGLRMAMAVTVPGSIEEAPGFMDKGDRRARIDVDAALLEAAMGDPDGPVARRLRTLGEAREVRIAWGRTDIPSEEVERFKSEMAAVKEEWDRRTCCGPSKVPAEAFGEGAETRADDEVTGSFIRARLRAARDHIRRGARDDARTVLRNLLREYPSHPGAREARLLLDELRP